MNANELRIGNWVYKNIADFLGNHYHQLIGWDIWQASTHPNELNVEFSPIPLTPEILEKAGFKNPGGQEYAGCYDYKEFSYYLPKKQVMIFFEENGISHWLPQKIEHLHKLQNLYFALTGEELEINLQ